MGKSLTLPPQSTSDPATADGMLVTGAFELLISTESGLTIARLEPGRAYVLGRGELSDVVVDDGSVSRRHAQLTVAHEDVVVEDLGSSNGTLVGGKPLLHGERTHVASGGVIGLGSTTLVLQRERVRRMTAETHPPGRMIPRRVILDPGMKKLHSMLELVAPTALSVLILGETGVGKEGFAHELHERSLRSRGPFLKLNCAALHESMLEAELFGFEKGSFTGAHTAKVGLFEAAAGGTLFLDEIGDMPWSTQIKILRMLESGEILRVGSVKPISVDVRICAATNQDLESAMANGRFRSDLYFRLNGITFTLPPLRQRLAEIAPLAMMFASEVAARLGRKPPRFSNELVELLESRPWVGNVRELRNAVERAVILSGPHGGKLLRPEDFPQDQSVTLLGSRTSSSAQLAATGFDRDRATSVHGLLPPRAVDDPSDGSDPPRVDLTGELRGIERGRIAAALDAASGNQSEAARMLGITRAVLLNRMKTFGISGTRAKPHAS